MVFMTKSGTTYYLDTINKMFCGGKFKNPVPYTLSGNNRFKRGSKFS